MKRFLLLLKIFAVTVLLFAAQKLLFMTYNSSYGAGLGLADWLSVVWHGLRLDVVSACYLMVVPILLVAVSSFFCCSLRKWMTWWFLPASILVSLAFAGDMVLYRFWGAKLDVADLVYARNPRDMLASLTPWDILFSFSGLAVLVALNLFLWRRVTPRQLPRSRHPVLYSFLSLLLLGLNLVGMRGGVEESTANPSYAYFSHNKYLNHAALNPFFNVLSSMSKSENLAEQFSSMSDQEMERLSAPIFQSYPDCADSLLLLSRPNIIILIWEGGGSLMTDNDSIAPQFARLKSQGVFFSHGYANNFRTDRGLVSLFSGWPALPTTSVMKMSGRCSRLPSIAKHLRDQGYHSAFYYGGDIDFTNMRGYLYEAGFDKVHGVEAYSDLPSDSKWGVQDHHFLQLQHHALPPSPFLAAFLTLSSHEPWEVPSHRFADVQNNSFFYTDSCIGIFVRQLQQSPLWDSLLLVIVPDHGVACHGVSVADIRAAHIPMLWLGGAVAHPRTIDCLMNQSDLAATLMAQLGIQAADFVFSRNVTSTRYSPTCVHHAFKNGFNLLDSLGCSQFECVNNQVVPSHTPHSPQALPTAQALLQRIYSTTGHLK